jgi:photosystem II stability/assembly factor-like uncharacterized protein
MGMDHSSDRHRTPSYQQARNLKLLLCALALTLAVVVRAQPVPDVIRPTASQSAWNGACSLSVHGAVVRWAVGDSGRVLKMVNGDTSAGYVVGKGLYDLCGVSFADESHGWIVGNKRDEPGQGSGVIFSTKRSGNEATDWVWSCPVIRPDVNLPFLKVQAMDVRHVWVTCGGGYMLYSNDAGARWAVTAKRPRPVEPGTGGSDHAR